MSLQLILGSSGSGKSYRLYDEIINKSIKNQELQNRESQNQDTQNQDTQNQDTQYRDTQYLVIVPEQFTLQTQKDIVSMHPNNGTMNIDILSFMRLAYRIFDEVGGNDKPVLEDTGKSMILRKVVASKKKELELFNRDIQKKGFINELKSLISEIYQYSINDKTLEEMKESIGNRPMLKSKLHDILIIYQGFSEFLNEKYITAEEILEVLCDVIAQSNIIKNSIICLDGFTGFTPAQYKLLTILIKNAKKVIITLTVDVRENNKEVKEYELFALTKKTIEKLDSIIEAEGLVKDKDILVGYEDKVRQIPYRFRENKALQALEENIFRYPLREYQGDAENVSIHIAKDQRAEVSYVIREIIHLIRTKGYRYNDIAIVTGDIEGYGRILTREFEKLGIPCFIDHKREVLSNPFVELIRSVLSMISNNFDYESVLRYLRCGLVPFDKEEIDIIENYVIALGIRGKNRYEEDWTRSYRGQDAGELIIINEVRNRLLEQVMPLYDVLTNKEGTIKDYTKALYEFGIGMEVNNGLEIYLENFEQEHMLLEMKEYEQIYGIVIELYDKLVELLGDDKVSIKEYIEILEAGFEEIKVGLIPPGLDPLVVGDIERTRLKDIKALFFVGVNDSVIPKKSGGGGILSDLDRQILVDNKFEMAPTKRQAAFTEQFYLYLNITKPSERLYLSYSKMSSDGKALRPAYLIDNIKQVLKNITIIDEDDERTELDYILGSDKGISYLINGIRNYPYEEVSETWKELFTYYNKKEEYKPMLNGFIESAYYINKEHGLSRQIAKELYGADLQGSVTRFEKFAGCAFAHYISYGLELQERREYRIAMPDIGNLFHTAIELYSRRLARSEYNWHTITDEIRNEWVVDCVKEACNGYGNSILSSTKRYEYIVNRVERITNRTLWALSEQIKSGDFEPIGYEVDFNGDKELLSLNVNLGDKESIRLKGRIDRVDTFENEEQVMIRVIDYKSGTTSFDLLSLYYGLQIQLALYLNAAKELMGVEHPGKEIIPAGILYYNINDPFVSKGADVLDSILKELRMNGIVNNSDEVIKRHDNSFIGGEGTLSPSVKSYIIPAESNKDGYLTKRSNIASNNQFNAIGKYVTKSVSETGKKILNGNTDIKPYQLDKKSACDYCPYRSVCGFDTTIDGFEYRKLKNLSKDEIWEELKKKGSDTDGMDGGTKTSN